MMKVKTSSGKYHYYDKKALWIDTDIHKELKEMAKDKGYTMGDMIDVMVRQYKRFG